MMTAIPDPALSDADLGVLSLQPAFVEGIVRDRRRFSSLESAYRHIFRRNLEWGMLLWNGVPVRIDYREDLPTLIPPLVDLLQFASKPDDGGPAEFHFESPNLEMLWRVELSGERIEIQGLWRRLPGGYEAALNRLDKVSMPREDFLCEWKLLLQQLLRAFTDAEAELTRAEARGRMQALRELEAGIPSRGRFYRY